jgi:hypothetical protein
MMAWILRMLGGAAGPYVAGGLAAVLVLSIGAAATLGLRLDHAKGDLVKAKAALVDPVSRRPWQDLAIERGRDLGTCRGNVERLDAALNRQNVAVKAFEARGQAMAAALAEAARAAKISRAEAQRAAAEILQARPGADVCDSADRLILEVVR